MSMSFFVHVFCCLLLKAYQKRSSAHSLTRFLTGNFPSHENQMPRRAAISDVNDIQVWRMAYHTDATCAASFMLPRRARRLEFPTLPKTKRLEVDGAGDPGERINRWASEDPSVRF